MSTLGREVDTLAKMDRAVSRWTLVRFEREAKKWTIVQELGQELKRVGEIL